MGVQTVIFYGRSGSGKGTQAVLLRKYLEEHDDKHDTLYFETGHALRDLAQGSTEASYFTKRVIEQGRLMPSLFVVWLWGDFLMKNLDETKHLLFDGVARRPEEAPLVAEAIKFFERTNPTILLMDVSREWAFEHLKDRAREDDTDESINKRLDWYDKDATISLEYFKKNTDFSILSVNGERPIQEVHEDILDTLKLS